MQSYTQIQSTASLQSSLALLLNNDRTSLSNSSGSAFPTVNTEVGMLCYRTDLRQLFILTRLTPITWAMVLDLSAPETTGEPPIAQAVQIAYQALARRLSGDDGGSIYFERPESGTSFSSNLSIRLKGNQIQFYDIGNQTRGFFLDITQGAASIASRIWHSNNDGAGSGLDADLLDGRQSGNAANQIPINNGTLNTNLNADMLDGLQASVFARLASPIFTGTVRAPTPATTSNTDVVATTAFVQAALTTVNLGSRVAKTGDTMTGTLTISSGALQLRGYGGNTNAGVVFLNASNNRYLHFNGSTYNMPGANLVVNGGTVWHTGNIGTPLNAVAAIRKVTTGSGNIKRITYGLERTGNSVRIVETTTMTNCNNCNCDCGNE